MTFVIKRDTDNSQYVAGYSSELGTPVISQYPYEFTKKSDALEVAKALNTFALIEDNPHRFEVWETKVNKLKETVISEGGNNSAYNQRLGNVNSHEADIEIEE